MIEVWLAASTIAVLVAAFLVAGARRRRSAPDEDTAAEFANRRRELRSEAQAQGLAGSAIAALEEELALDEIDHATDAGSAGSRAPAASPPLLPLCAGTAAIVVASLAFYALWGEPHASTLAEAATALDGARPNDDAQLRRLERALASRVRRKAEDGDGWYFLGVARMRQSDYRGAADAFAELRALTGANAQVDLSLAQASYLADGGTITAATRALVDRALASNPQHPDLLELLAADALRRSDYLCGARYLLRAMGQAMAAGRRDVLAQTLALARARLDPQRPAIEATIHAEGLSAPWLMVFARPVGGGMPLAAVRLPAQATQTVVLDDAASMNDTLPLSSAPLVEVVARLSQTGTATAAEAEAVSEPVDAAQRPSVTLTLAALPDSSP